MQIIPTESAFFMQIQSFAVILVRNGSAKCGHAVTGGASHFFLSPKPLKELSGALGRYT